jgi:hypothetical protein
MIALPCASFAGLQLSEPRPGSVACAAACSRAQTEFLEQPDGDVRIRILLVVPLCGFNEIETSLRRNDDWKSHDEARLEINRGDRSVP